MIKESIIRQRHNRFDKAFKELSIRIWINSERSADMTAKELGASVFVLYMWGRDMKENKQTEVEREPKTLAASRQKTNVFKRASSSD